MSMSAESLKNRMKSKMDAVADSYRNGTKDNGDAILALAEAIIEEIQSNAEVTVTGGSSAGVYGVE